MAGWFGSWLGAAAGRWWGYSDSGEATAWDTAQGLARIFRPMRAGHARPATAEVRIQAVQPLAAGSVRAGVLPEGAQVSLRGASVQASGNTPAWVALGGPAEIHIRGARLQCGGAASAVAQCGRIALEAGEAPAGGGGGANPASAAFGAYALLPEAEGIQNPTDEELIVLIHAARGLDKRVVYR